MIRSGWPSSSRYHRTGSSLDDKRDFDSHRIGRLRATICCLRVSLDLSSLNDEGVDNHKVSPHAIGPSSHNSIIVTFPRSRPEDADISGKGAYDHIGLCVSTGSLASSWQKVRITIRCACVLPDPRVTITELRLFRGLDRKTLTSPGRVQMTTLVSTCQRARLPLAEERCR